MKILGCIEGRSMPGRWVDFSLSGHQLVCHWVGDNFKAVDHYSPVGTDEVPGIVPYFALFSALLPVASWNFNDYNFKCLQCRISDCVLALMISIN